MKYDYVDRWNEVTGLVVTCISNEKEMCKSVFLPTGSEGIYRFFDKSEDVFLDNIFMEKTENTWYIKSYFPVYFLDGDKKIYQVKLRPDSLFSAYYSRNKLMIFTRERFFRDGITINYEIPDPCVITIGRREYNDIQYSCPYVSSHHATLNYKNGEWLLTDNHSRNGTFVNERRIYEHQLVLGDVVDIFGLRLIIGVGFIAINTMDNRVTINSGLIRVLKDEDNTEITEDNRLQKNDADAEVSFFYRSPRKRLPMETAAITIENPPMPLNGDDIPLVLRMGGSVAGMANAFMFGNIFTVLSSAIFPFINKGYNEKQKQEYEKKRIEKYREYLRAKEQEIQAEVKKEEHILKLNYPDLFTVLKYSKPTQQLWERRKYDDDFLTIRVGSGKIPLLADINYPKDQFSLDTDVLEEEMRALADKEVYLENVPILFSFTEHFIAGALGSELNIWAFFQHVLLQVILLHSYDEVKTIFLLSSGQLEQIKEIRYLPHAWDDTKNVRFIATTESEAFHIGEYLASQLEAETSQSETNTSIASQKRPYYVVFALDKKLFESMEVFKNIMIEEVTSGVSILTLYDELHKDCRLAFDLNVPGEYKIVHLRDIEKKDQIFHLDYFSQSTAESAAKSLSNIQLKTVTESSSLPKMITFLEMFGVGKIEQLNILNRWEDNNPIASLSVPIGVAPDGSPFMLDLHEKYQGPHGLVAGTTGSGKSEFLLTYILSLAVNFHPNEVAFVLIDYKGGGLAGAFDDPKNGIHLPHLVGKITNLDGSAIARSLSSLHSEVTRRQQVFNEAKSKTGQGTMDIYAYQRFFRSGKVEEPMPHLFIISDEFAELKQQQPEFLDELVSIARIGRSLGVHLILATQKPGGVVTEQILSNTKFRACLKVQDKQDSLEMLKRPEAAELRETGRFYLQVGNNELFSLGQSAWSGAAYEPQDKIVSKQDDSIQFIDLQGNEILEEKPQTKKESTGYSQLVEVTRELIRCAERISFENKSLWLPPLPNLLDAQLLDEQNTGSANPAKQEHLRYCAGLLDDPERQAQYPLIFNLEKCGHFFVIGEPGCGKTTFVQSMLSVLVKKYSPEELNYYILDFSSRLLRLFDKLPHSGGVLGEEQDNELDAFFRMIRKIVAERKLLFSQLEVDSFESACKKTPLPFILVIIDNLAGLSVLKNGMSHYDVLHTYIKEASIYGVRFIITASHLNECPSRIRQELTERIALRLKDRYEYFDALDCRIKYVPADQKGRGLYVWDGRPLEMQLSMFGTSLSEEDRINSLKELINNQCAVWNDHLHAKRLPVISEEETYKDFCERFRLGRIPLGFAIPAGTAVALPLKQMDMLSVYFGNKESIVPLFNNFLHAALLEKMETAFVSRKNKSCDARLCMPEDTKVYSLQQTGVKDLSLFLSGVFEERIPVLSKYCTENGLDENSDDIYKDVYSYMRTCFRPILIIIEDLADFCKSAEDMEKGLSFFSSVLLIARKYLIYFVGGIYPGEQKQLSGCQLYPCFNRKKLIMLVGGNLKNQSLLQLPYGIEQTGKPGLFNRCLINYEDELYNMLIPMEREVVEEEEDDRSIFQVI